MTTPWKITGRLWKYFAGAVLRQSNEFRYYDSCKRPFGLRSAMAVTFEFQCSSVEWGQKARILHLLSTRKAMESMLCMGEL
jgi:hypothetical protein